MLRLLIADATMVFADALKKQLRAQYLVETCQDGAEVLEKIREFDPDILLTDLRLPGVDGLSVIRALRASGRDTKVVVMSGYIGQSVLGVLEAMQVDYVFSKPCDLGAVSACIRDLSAQIGNGCASLEDEADCLLLSLGFRIERTAYPCVHDALCMKYENFYCGTTKELYPAVAKRQGGNSKRVEKAIRDAIHATWSSGNKSLWKLYFQPKGDGEAYCPSNDEFLARMAKALMSGRRLRLPYAK